MNELDEVKCSWPESIFFFIDSEPNYKFYMEWLLLVSIIFPVDFVHSWFND